MSLGRPRALDDAKRREVSALLTAGFEFDEAARYVGCTPRTIRREIRRSPAFRRQVHDALLAARLAPDKLLRQAAGRNWRGGLALGTHRAARVRPQRPGACTLDDLDAAGRWIIDVALHDIHHMQREAALDRLRAVLQDVKTQIVQRTNSKKPIKMPPTDFYDLTELLCHVHQSGCGDGLLSSGGQKSADKSHSTFVPPGVGGTSENAASDDSPGGQNSGLKSAQTCSPRAAKVEPSPLAESPLHEEKGHHAS